MRAVGPWALALGVCVTWGAGPAAAAGRVYPAVQWSGTVADPALEAKAPAGGVIGTREAFAALWRAWGLSDPVPAIDFGDYFVVVLTATGQPTRVMRLDVGADGDGRWLGAVEKGANKRPGFGYGVAVFPRAVLKTVGGKEIPKE